MNKPDKLDKVENMALAQSGYLQVILRNNSGYIFYGEFVQGKKEGYGIMKKYNKEVYIGLWKNNQRHGWGKIYSPEGKMVENG